MAVSAPPSPSPPFILHTPGKKAVWVILPLGQPCIAAVKYKYKIHSILEAIDYNLQEVQYFTFDHSLPNFFLNDLILAGNEDDVAL